MTKPQIIESDGRPAFVVLPYEDWQRIEEMLEDAADSAAIDAWTRNPTETFPASVADALIAGDNPVAIFRRHRGQSQTDLAQAARISAPYLNQIESGKRTPSTEVLKRLAGALKIPVDVLIG